MNAVLFKKKQLWDRWRIVRAVRICSRWNKSRASDLLLSGEISGKWASPHRAMSRPIDWDAVRTDNPRPRRCRRCWSKKSLNGNESSKDQQDRTLQRYVVIIEMKSCLDQWSTKSWKNYDRSHWYSGQLGSWCCQTNEIDVLEMCDDGHNMAFIRELWEVVEVNYRHLQWMLFRKSEN